MAKDKRSFLLYTDVHHTVKKLTDDQAGKLFKHILSYVNDENPCLTDILLEVAFEPIKQSLKRDLRKYEIIREKRSLAGKASADKRQQLLTLVESVEQNEHMSTNSTVSDNVSVSDSVNVNVNEIEDKITKSLIVSFENFWDLYDKNVGQIKCETIWMQIPNEERIECINKLPEYIKSTPDKQFRSNPDKYLKDKAWRNEIIKKDTSFKLTPAFEISAEDKELARKSLYYGKH